MDSVIYAFSSFYCLCVEINKLFNIIHAFSICIHCVAKLIKYLKSKKLVFFFLFRKKKGIKNTKDVYRLIKNTTLPAQKHRKKPISYKKKNPGNSYRNTARAARTGYF